MGGRADGQAGGGVSPPPLAENMLLLKLVGPAERETLGVSPGGQLAHGVCAKRCAQRARHLRKFCARRMRKALRSAVL